MNDIPTVLRSDYFFDSGMTDYTALFDGVSAVWEIVCNLQKTTIADRITRERCGAVQGGIPAGLNVSGSVEVRVAPGASAGPNVFISGEGGIVCIDEGAAVLPGVVISTGSNAVYIGRGAEVGPNAHLDAFRGSICVGEAAKLRQGAYIREISLIGRKAIVGNSCEVKCAIIGPEAEVPHFNYIGDSVLGHKAHTGAGVKLSNVKVLPDPAGSGTVKIRHNGKTYDTGMRKFGAILGDRSQVGCNSVTNPGTLIGRNAIIYSGSSAAGFIPSNTVVKLRQTLESAGLRT